ncbi:hypothetical protein SAMN04488072_11836 [Lentibacillus halodurans]|uniref:Uncharacterized protein n=1 Tax=Lentibacillus halodurans TaxID=237679 RepID=A0A1I1AFS2_9BACI|nr:hypothetical protein [Lentibacillus halodurans]SFB35348.1 hypothetical protein SAMN04488072_11836 [Lentibacillus halodurans]
MMDWPELTHLSVLLPERIDFSYIFIFTGIVVTYILIRPLINWIVTTKSVKLLSYIMTSLLILLLFLGGIVLTAVFQLPLLEVTLRSLAIFGGYLVIVHFIQFILRSKKRHV